jgi:hypothetical protein
MLVKDVLSRIRFNTSTMDDLSGRSVSNLFTNKNIIEQLTFSMDDYAVETLGIEGIFSMPLDTNVQFIEAPPLAIRTQSIRYMFVFMNGTMYPLDGVSINRSVQSFPVYTSGVPRWVFQWENNLYIQSCAGTPYNTTTITSSIDKNASTIPVALAGSFPLKSGRITIDSEKITYKYRDNTNFYQCERGQEDTEAASHLNAATVNENNLQIFYYKKNFRIPVYDNNVIDQYYLDKEMEICDDHIQCVINETSYNLLMKVDVKRAALYQADYSAKLQAIKEKLMCGRFKIKNHSDILNPSYYEQNVSRISW